MDLWKPRFLLGPGQEGCCAEAASAGAPPAVLVPLPFPRGLFDPEWAASAGEELRRVLGLCPPGTELCGLLPAGELEMEPYGELPFARCVAHYASAAGVLAREGAGSVLIHRAKSLLQARAGVLGARAAGLPVYVSLEIHGEGEDLFGGGDILAAFVTLQELGIAAFGFYSSVAGIILEPLELTAPWARVPFLSLTRDLTGSLPAAETDALLALRTAGLAARGASWQAVFGAGRERVAAAAGALAAAPPCPIPRGDYRASEEIWAATEAQLFYLDGNEELTPPIPCQLDMADEVIALEHQGGDILCIRVESPDEGLAISRNNASLTRIPAAFLSDDEDALDSALFFYNGRALVDSRSMLPPDRLSEIARRYGAVVV